MERLFCFCQSFYPDSSLVQGSIVVYQQGAAPTHSMYWHVAVPTIFDETQADIFLFLSPYRDEMPPFGGYFQIGICVAAKHIQRLLQAFFFIS